MRSRSLLLMFGLFILVAGGIFAYQFLRSQSKPPTTSSQPQIFSNSDQPVAQPVASPQNVVVPVADTLVEVIVGTAQLSSSGGSQVTLTDASDSATVQSGDTIHTGDNTVATVDYQDGTVVRMGANTTITIKEKAGTAANSTIEKVQESLGTIYVRFRKILGVRDGLDVETPSVVAAVRGTKFNLTVSKDKESKLIVMEHTVQVKEKDAKTGTVMDNTLASVSEQQQMKSIVFQRRRIKNHLVIGKLAPEDHEKEWLDFNGNADTFLDASPSAELQSQIASGAAQASSSGQIRKRRVRKFLEPRVRDLLLKIGLTNTTSPSPSVKPTTSMPGTGLTRCLVQTSQGQFPMTCVGADKNAVRVVTDSGNDNTCANNCTVMPLAAYAQRNG